jgi:hypothetical protein
MVPNCYQTLLTQPLNQVSELNIRLQKKKKRVQNLGSDSPGNRIKPTTSWARIDCEKTTGNTVLVAKFYGKRIY